MTKTAQEIKQELDAKNSEARALRRALKEAQRRELLSAKTALGEALAALIFADSPEAMQALVQRLNDPAIADQVRAVLGVNNTENHAPEEPETDPQWGSDGGDEQAVSSVPTAQW